MFNEHQPKSPENNNVVVFENKLEELIGLFRDQGKQDEKFLIRKFMNCYLAAFYHDGLQDPNYKKIAIYGGYMGISPDLE